jgi:hypothetical protein
MEPKEMPHENREAFVTTMVSNKEIYDLLIAHGEDLREIKEQTTKTNGRVTELERVMIEAKADIANLKLSNIVLYVRDHWIILSIVAILLVCLVSDDVMVLLKGIGNFFK